MTDSQTLQQWYDHQSPPSKVYYKSNFTFQTTFTSAYKPPKSDPIDAPPNQPLRYDREVKDDNKKIRVRPIPESPRGEVMIFKMDL